MTSKSFVVWNNDYSKPVTFSGTLQREEFFLKSGNSAAAPHVCFSSREVRHISLAFMNKGVLVSGPSGDTNILQLLVVFTVTPSKLRMETFFNKESLKSGKWKKINIQKALPRIRSVQYFICEIFGKTFYPNLWSFVWRRHVCVPFRGTNNAARNQFWVFLLMREFFAWGTHNY